MRLSTVMCSRAARSRAWRAMFSGSSMWSVMARESSARTRAAGKTAMPSARLTGSRFCGSIRGMSITIELPPDVEKRLAGLPDLGQRVADFLRGQAEQLAVEAGADSPRLRALDALQARLALDAGK